MKKDFNDEYLLPEQKTTKKKRTKNVFGSMDIDFLALRGRIE